MTPAAQCAIHPQASATRTCARCGNFMCDECCLGGSELSCPKCRALLGEGFPYSRDNHDFSRLWDFSFAAWKREWVMLSVGFVILTGVNIGVGLVGNVFQAIVGAIAGKGVGAVVGAIAVQLLVVIIQQIVNGIVQMGVLRMVFDVLKGGRADISRMFTQLPKAGAYIVQWLLIIVMIGLPTLVYMGVLFIVAIKVGHVSMPDLDGPPERIAEHLLDAAAGGLPILILGLFVMLIPLIYFTLPISFIPMEIVYGNANAWESITRSYKLASGFRLSLLGYGFVGVGILLVGFMACCVGVLPALALLQLLVGALYLSVRNGSGLPPPVES